MCLGISIGSNPPFALHLFLPSRLRRRPPAGLEEGGEQFWISFLAIHVFEEYVPRLG